MIRRILARHRLTVRYWACWTETTRKCHGVGPRPVLALQRTPDLDCPDCGGSGVHSCGDACVCTPFLPLLRLWLPHFTARFAAAVAYRRNRHLYSNEPPF